MVNAYFARKVLAEIGYRFDAAELDDFEMSCYLVIASKVADLREKDMKGKGHGTRH